MSLHLVTGVLMAMGVASTGTEGAAGGAPAAGTPDSAGEAEVIGLVREAARQYDQGLFDEALQTLERAQALSPKPAILYNIGQVQRARGDFAAALAAYSSFLAQTPPADPNRERALRWQEEMRASIERAAASAGGAPLTSSRVAAPPALPTMVAQASPMIRPSVRRDEEIATRPFSPARVVPKATRAARATAWSLIGAGALLEVGALLLEWKVKSIESELNSGGLRNQQFDNLTREGQRDAGWALWAGIGGGVLTVSGGAVLFMSRPSGSTPTSTALVGWVGTF